MSAGRLLTRATASRLVALAGSVILLGACGGLHVSPLSLDWATKTRMNVPVQL